MDRYTLMCSKLTQLQEELDGWDYCIIHKCKTVLDWECQPICPEIFDKEPTKRCYETDWISLPSLEDLIEMLGKKYRGLDYFYETEVWIAYSIKWFKRGKVPEEALLKLVAYEKWGLTWSDEKETWEDNNDT
jgi:hypothetical protein